MFNSAKNRRIFHFALGSSLVFIYSSAQVLYSYVMHPDSLSPDIYALMLKSAKIPEVILSQFKSQSLSQSIDSQKLYGHLVNSVGLKNIKNVDVINFLKNGNDKLPLSCGFTHPTYESCSNYFLWLFMKAFSEILVVYAPLNFIPLLLFRKGAAPLKAVKSTFRSSAFFGVLVASYQLIFCQYRNLFKSTWKYSYFLIGSLASSLAISVESRNRKRELSMYVLPKAIESLWNIMVKKSWVSKVFNGFETLVFMLSMGIIHSFYSCEKDTVSPYIGQVLKHFLKI
jgi:hypothetical protein